MIAIENRLGLKYWAGCTEDHVGKYFEGLENYPDTRSVRTFSRKELSDIIDQAGEFKTTFYYPYPDYKFPMTIYSDKRLPKKGELRDNFCNFDRNRIQLFNEGKVYDSLTDAGLFQEFSNSFLVIVERRKQMKEIIFSKYSNERSRSFAIRTDIVEEDGKRWLEKKWLYPEGKNMSRMKNGIRSLIRCMGSSVSEQQVRDWRRLCLF